MDIQKEKEEIAKEIKEIINNIDEETLKKASKEDLLEYFNLIEEIQIKLKDI